MWAQRELRLEGRRRGFHLVTGEVVGAVPELERLAVGLLHVFVRHTSASLTLNENASPDVLRDFRSFFDSTVPEDASFWTHRSEGSDDMPAHVKSSLRELDQRADRRRPARTRDVAGDLPVRAPRYRRPEDPRAHGLGRGARSELSASSSEGCANMCSCAGTTCG